MSDDPERTLEEWKTSMQDEHDTAIANPDPDASHEIEGITQVSYRYTFAYDADSDSLEQTDRTQVDEPREPELFSCACGVRGMTRAEARDHLGALDD
ncbi:hypothetical protein [Halococcoides cellulosivorans]|uniref:Uncharacterized protein n=1 Tax=Halococcoides cellulosivorans TaxID=1679096 RepID=A0A2R4WZN8_9EURY|nr:hypothetical protein [Halococcoides cellulosivorans]AWB26965.1 hypothetical protein HARCEL1_04185 [Halococcoides cellulosivorans]